MSDDQDDRLDRDAIFARRARFVRAIAKSVGAALVVGSFAACAQPCLSADVTVDGGSNPDTANNDTPTADGMDATPMPCLAPLFDAGDASDASDAVDASDDAAPMPCLSPPLDSGTGD